MRGTRFTRLCGSSLEHISGQCPTQPHRARYFQFEMSFLLASCLRRKRKVAI